jgi:hypothetical protein
VSRLRLIDPSASPEEAAATVAAIERFTRATAPDDRPAPSAGDRWRCAALIEGISRDRQAAAPEPWLTFVG